MSASRPAGRFLEWLEGARSAVIGSAGSDVPCDGCTACCESSQFVHIAPDEVDALARIPAQLLFPAPGLPDGHVLLGYDERGRCPLLGDDGCTVYDVRPRTCRTYDCRVFVAAGVEPEASQPAVAARVREWSFDEPGPDDRAAHDAVRAAAAFLAGRPEALPDGRPPATATQLAVLAVEASELFRDGRPGTTEVRVALGRRRGGELRS